MISPSNTANDEADSSSESSFSSTDSEEEREMSSSKSMQEKLDMAQPYGIFFNKLRNVKCTWNCDNSIKFSDLLCSSLGELKSSLQLTNLVDIDWIYKQYQIHGVGEKPLTLVHGMDDMEEYLDTNAPPNVKHCFFEVDQGFHHSKVGIYAYKDNSIRIVVSTSNLVSNNWKEYNTIVWVSPACPKMDDTKRDDDCSGQTGFKRNLINYLSTYNLPLLIEWINMVKRADFSAIKVFLVTSVPGVHYPKEEDGCHLYRVGSLLSRYCSFPAKSSSVSDDPLMWSIIAQASAMGLYGKSPWFWLRSVLLRSLASHKSKPFPSKSGAKLSLVYPSRRNVNDCYFFNECLMYERCLHIKQRWIRDYLHEWKSDKLGRSKVIPHNKSYCRISPCQTKLAYFLLTSANITRAAWGGDIQRRGGIYVRSYEVGVLFLPSLFDEQYFTIQDDKQETKLFPFLIDLPLSPYKSDDEPYCCQ